MAVFSLISNSANLRQAYLPFHQDPGQAINSVQSNSTSVGKAPPQFFSFKSPKTSLQRLNICPSSFMDFMSSDIGYKLLYNRDFSGNITQKSVDVNTIFNCIPTIQIREFAVDSVLDQLVNMFRDLINVFNPGDKNAPTNKVESDAEKGQSVNQEAADQNKESGDKTSGIWEKLKTMLKSKGFYNQFCSVAGIEEQTKVYHNGNDEYNYILRFPYMFYYRLLSSVTTNIYELPINPTCLLTSQGEGWGMAKPYEISIPGQDLIGSIPILGSIINSVMKSISINTNPTWDPSAAKGENGPEIKCTFKLFNDTADAAMSNFVFVNTIVPNNMWYNYNIFKRAPALYDIKVEGFYRLFMCTATMSVKPNGPVRKMPAEWISTLVKKHHGSQTSEGLLTANMVQHELVKVPDIYDVDITFKSLLPNNFNNFLYTYSGSTSARAKELQGYVGNAIPQFAEAIKTYLK